MGRRAIREERSKLWGTKQVLTDLNRSAHLETHYDNAVGLIQDATFRTVTIYPKANNTVALTIGVDGKSGSTMIQTGNFKVDSSGLPSATSIIIASGSNSVQTVGSTANIYFGRGSDVVLVGMPTAKVLQLSDSLGGGVTLNMTEMTAPASPSANQVTIYAEDNGVGKTRLMALFPTGVAIPLATEL